MQRIERAIFYSLILFLPTQLGKHFWPDFSYVSGIRIDYLSPTLYFTDVLLMVLFLVFLIRHIRLIRTARLKSQIARLPLNPQKLWIYLFVLVFLISNILWATRPLLSLYGMTKLFEFSFLAIYIARTIRNRSQLRHIAFLFAFGSIFESFLAIAQYLNQGSLNGIFYFLGERSFTGTTPGIANADIGSTLILRPYGTFSHPNVLAAYLLVAIILVWSFILTSKKQWKRILRVVTLIVCSIALLITFSRVAIFIWVILLFCILGRLAFHSLKSVKAKILFVLIFAISLVVISFVPVIREVLLRFSQTSLSDESVTEREELLSAAFTMIREHPIFGVGLYNFIPALAPLQNPMPLGLYLQPVHNIFMLVFVETGIIGLGFFIGLFVTTVERIKKQDMKMKGALFILLFVIILTGMFDHYWLTLQQGQLLFATIIGLSWAKMQKE